MYEQEQDTDDMNINNKNTRSKKNSEDNSFRFYYPDGDIYNRDDEFFIVNNDENLDNLNTHYTCQLSGYYKIFFLRGAKQC